MDLRETERFGTIDERDHWWIRTRFTYLEKAFRGLGNGLRVLELGCGTAQNLRHLREHPELSARIDQLTGVDAHLPEDTPTPDWLGPRDSIQRTLPDTEADAGYDLLVAMDVLEHIEDDHGALGTWLELIKPGGRVFITVPAFQSLWSDHDRFLGHFRRYNRKSLLNLTQRSQLEPSWTRYAFGHLLVPAYIIRRLIPKITHAQADAASSDLKQSHPFVNTTLTLAGHLESRLGGCPFGGTSVVGLFTKPNPA